MGDVKCWQNFCKRVHYSVTTAVKGIRTSSPQVHSLRLFPTRAGNSPTSRESMLPRGGKQCRKTTLATSSTHEGRSSEAVKGGKGAERTGWSRKAVRRGSHGTERSKHRSKDGRRGCQRCWEIMKSIFTTTGTPETEQRVPERGDRWERTAFGKENGAESRKAAGREKDRLVS